MPRPPTHDFFTMPLSPCVDTGNMQSPNLVQDNMSPVDFNSSQPYHHHNAPPPPPQMPYPHYDRYYSYVPYQSTRTQSHYSPNTPTQTPNYAHVIRNPNSNNWYNGASNLTSVVSMDYGPQDNTSCKLDEDRRQRKNSQARVRAAKLRTKVKQLSEVKHVSNEDEALLETFEGRRRRKNIRSRERLLEKKVETERILDIPPLRRTPYEQKYLDDALKAKKKKNEGDRWRRQIIKRQKLEKERKQTKRPDSEHTSEARSISPDSVKKASKASSPPSMVARLCVPVSPVSTMKHTINRSYPSKILFEDDYSTLDFPSLFKDH